MKVSATKGTHEDLAKVTQGIMVMVVAAAVAVGAVGAVGVVVVVFCFGCNGSQWARVSSYTRFLDHRTPLDA